MVGEVLAGFGAFKAMFDMAKALKDINDAAIRNGAIVELQEQILGAHVAQAALLERVSFLEKEVARFETWDTEKQRYELKNVWDGAVAYSVKEEMRGSEPPHWICANCYQNSKKSYLQKTEVPKGDGSRVHEGGPDAAASTFGSSRSIISWSQYSPAA